MIRILVIITVLISQLSFGLPREIVHWEFFFGEKLPPGELSRKGDPVTVPAMWSQYLTPKGLPRYKDKGMATYRAIVDLNPKKYYRIKLDGIYSAVELVINGRKFKTGSRVADTAKSEIPYRINRSFLFQGRHQTEILIYISSWNHNSGGIWSTPKIDLADVIVNEKTETSAFEAFVASSLVIFGFYNIALYLLRRKNLAALYFGFFCLVMFFKLTSTTQSSLLMRVFDISFRNSVKIDYLTGCLGAMLAVIYIRYRFPKEASPKIVWILMWASLSVMTVIVVANVEFFSGLLTPFQLIIFSCMLYGAFVTVYAVKKRRSGSFLFFAGCLIFILGAFHDILSTQGYSPIETQIAPYALYIMIFVQSVSLAKEFNNAFQKVEENEATISDLNMELKDHIHHLDDKVEEKTRDIKSTLMSIPQMVFRISLKDDELYLDPEFSPNIWQIIDHEPEDGDNPLYFILVNSNLTANDQSQILTVIKSSLYEDIIQFECNEHILPREVIINEHIIEVDYSPMVNDQDLVEKILFVLKDVTTERALQVEAEANMRKAKKLLQLSKIKSSRKIEDFLETSKEYIHQCRDTTNRTEVLRNLHTLKGLALTFGFSEISDRAHLAEDEILRKENLDASTESILRPIGDSIREYEAIVHEIYSDRGDRLAVTKEDLIKVQELIDKQDLTAANRYVLFLHEFNLEKLLETETSSIKKLAAKLGKAVPQFKFVNDEYVLHGQICQVIKGSFIHLLRNAIDHGIEVPGERLKKGKSETGTIYFDVSNADNKYLEIRMFDDGAGLNMNTLRERAKDLGLTDLTSIPEQVIFRAGVSTAEEVTEISGRGVGMEAVKKFIELAGGTISINLEEEKDGFAPFSFKISLPYDFASHQSKTTALAKIS